MSMRRAEAQNTFISGEFSPKLWRRRDLQKYLSGLRSCLNMVTERHGGVQRRGGTVYVASTKSNGIARLIPFRRSSSTNLVIELGDEYMRFYENGAVVESGGSPVEVSTPWADTEIDAVRFDQSGDVMYLTHPDYQPRKLSRTSATSFTLAAIDQVGGPFDSENTDDTKTLQLSAATGTATMTATGHSPFTAGHVGSLWKIRWQDRSAYSKWEGQVAYLANALVISRGKGFKCATGGTSGTSAPDHTEGDEWDGKVSASCEWTYQNSGYVVVKVTAYTSATQVTVEVQDDVTAPPDIVSTGSYKWSAPSWSDEAGWPATVAFFNDRIAYSKGNEIYLSQNGLFEDFSPTDEHGDIVATVGLRFVLSDSQANVIRWMRQVQNVLLIGTTGSEFTLGPANLSEPFGPDNVQASPQSFHGSADFIQPVRVNEAVLFANRSARRLYEITAQEVTNRYAAAELSILSDHLLTDGLFEADFSESPQGIWWAITNQGELRGMTYEPRQDVVGWHRHTLGGTSPFVESIAVIPSDDERYEELWMIVARTVNGGTVRYIERIGTPFEDEAGLEDAVFLDASKTVTGTDLDEVTAAHLLNETNLWALVDGKAYEGLSADGSGVIAMPDGVTGDTITVGYNYTSEIETLTPDIGSQIGAGQGKRQSVYQAHVMVDRTNVLKYRRGTDSAYQLLNFYIGGDAMDDPVPLFSGYKTLDVGANFETEPTIVFRQDQPLPMTIRGVTWDVTIADR